MTTSISAAANSGRVDSAAIEPGRVLLAFGVVYLIWGSTYAGVRIALESLPPLLLASVRFLLAGSILLFLAGGTRSRASAGEWLRAGVAGGLMLSTGGGLVHWAEQIVSSSLAALIICATPLFMVLLDWARPGGARPPGAVLGGVALGLCGMVLLVGASTSGPSRIDPLGVAALCVSALAWAVGSLYTRYAIGGKSSHGAARQLLVGGALLLVVSLLSGDAARFELERVTLRSFLAFAYLVVFGSVIAYTTYGWLLRVSTPARVSTTAYVTPIVATLLGWLALGETLTTGQSCGALVILAGVVLMTRPA